jgi:hypothetical protein
MLFFIKKMFFFHLLILSPRYGGVTKKPPENDIQPVFGLRLDRLLYKVMKCCISLLKPAKTLYFMRATIAYIYTF